MIMIYTVPGVEDLESIVSRSAGIAFEQLLAMLANGE